MKVTEMGCDMPGASRVSTLLLYWPDWDGAWTVKVRRVAPGARSPTAIELAVVGKGVGVPALTCSVQLRIVNFEKSPEETMLALL